MPEIPPHPDVLRSSMFDVIIKLDDKVPPPTPPSLIPVFVVTIKFWNKCLVWNVSTHLKKGWGGRLMLEPVWWGRFSYSMPSSPFSCIKTQLSCSPRACNGWRAGRWAGLMFLWCPFTKWFVYFEQTGIKCVWDHALLERRWQCHPSHSTVVEGPCTIICSPPHL